MEVTFYKMNCDRRKVDKSKNLTTVQTYSNVIFKEGQSIVRPSIKIHSRSSSFPSDVNYVYIKELKSYYFITDVVTHANEMYEIILEEDVLYTYKNEIKNLTAVISRQETKNNRYLADNIQQTYVYERVQTFLFPEGLTSTNASNILVVAGGGED